MQKLKPDPGDS